MKRISFLFFMLCAVVAHTQDFRAFIEHVNALPDPGDRQDAVDSFMNVITPAGIPFISNDTAYFIHRGNAATVLAVGDFNGWSTDHGYELTRVSDTDMWYHGHAFEMNARLDYKLVVDGNWILDPLNLNTISGGFGPNSELAMPDYIQPWEIEYIGTSGHGAITGDALFSPQTNGTFQIKIYLPFGYDPQRSGGYPVAYFQDGQESIDLGSAVNVIDNLIDAGEIDEIMAVFVVPNDRGTEYAGSLREAYTAFFVETLVPYIDDKYNTAAAATHRAVIGASFGGNISALISYNHPEVIANCGIHSGAFWPNDNEAYDLIVNGPRKDIKFASVWGSYESLDGQMTSLKDHFVNEGYELVWDRLPEGHSWGLWRATFDDILKFFFSSLGPVTATDEPMLDSGLAIALDNNLLHYELILSQPTRYMMRLIDMSGKIIFKTCSNGETIRGSIPVDDIPAGVYSLTLEARGRVYSGKVSIVR